MDKESTVRPTPPEARFLGKSSPRITAYDPGILVPLPRAGNRAETGIDAARLGFVGWDIWTAWEVSFLLDSGLPVVGVVQFRVPASSRCIVESKSVKLYLSGFNAHRLGATVAEARENFLERLGADLSDATEGEVAVRWVDHRWGSGAPLYDCDPLEGHAWATDGLPTCLESRAAVDPQAWFTARSALLRSQCRITRQPDWGDVYIACRGQRVPDERSLLGLILEMRDEEHFHEEIVEQLYQTLFDTCAPEALLVYAQYTRRGGVDINPMRASDASTIEQWWGSGFAPFVPTFRQ